MTPILFRIGVSGNLEAIEIVTLDEYQGGSESAGQAVVLLADGLSDIEVGPRTPGLRDAGFPVRRRAAL